ncbi:hypothetical protein RFI_27301, partial [Reticulomyxa filosa]
KKKTWIKCEHVHTNFSLSDAGSCSTGPVTGFFAPPKSTFLSDIGAIFAGNDYDENYGTCQKWSFFLSQLERYNGVKRPRLSLDDNGDTFITFWFDYANSFVRWDLVGIDLQTGVQTWQYNKLVYKVIILYFAKYEIALKLVSDFFPLLKTREKKEAKIKMLRITIGDRVQLSDYGQGVVRFIGPVLFAEGVWYGVQLDNDSGQNDGVVNDHKYFECKKNHGILLRNECNKFRLNVWTYDPKCNTIYVCVDHHFFKKINEGTLEKKKYHFICINTYINININAYMYSKGIRIGIGDRVELPEKGIGTVRFIGPVNFDEGIWYGIELDEKNGKNDGSINQIRYFKCPNPYGVFVKEEELFTMHRG